MAEQVENQVERLNAARTKAQELTQEKSRIAGELNALKKRQAELEKRSKDEFDCTVDELSGLIGQLEKDAEISLSNAEKILGLKDGKPEQGEVAEPAVEEEEPSPDDDGGLGV